MNRSTSVRRLMVSLARNTFVGLLLIGLTQGSAFGQTGGQPSDQALAQIAGLIAEKNARSPTQQKIDSQLIYAINQARTGLASPSAPQLRITDVADAQGRVEVEVRGEVTNSLISRVQSLGGQLVHGYAYAKTIVTRMPLLQLEVLAGDDRVVAITLLTPALAPQPPGGGGPTAVDGSSKSQPALGLDAKRAAEAIRPVLTPRLQRFRTTLEKALLEHNSKLAADVEQEKSLLQAKIGAATAQGDAAHRARNARNFYGVNGQGLRIGVISDSFNDLGAYAADIASGDLPGPGNPNGFTAPVLFAGSGDLGGGGSDEGRAMLQIVHDLAPGAELYFATAFNSLPDFANNILALRGIASAAPPFGNVSPGCDIIIDDIFYFVESGLHEGQPASVTSTSNIALLTQAVNDVTASGALYFSSAGNSGGVTQGTAGAWEGDFASAGTLTIPGQATPVEVHDWDPGAAVAQSNTITAAARPIVHWADPIGGSANDYDMFVLNSGLTAVVSSSTNVQTGTQDPIENIFASTPANNRIVIVRGGGAAARFLSLTSNRGRLQFATTGQTRGHSIAPRAYAVAATPAAAAFGVPTPNGPFPGPFVSTNQVEPFNSDGPRRVFFDVNNAPLTPGNFLATGGALRVKPDITAADGVATTLPGGSGLNPFYGTSAAAPHAGAIAALMKSASPTASQTIIRLVFNSTALDIMAPGVDRDSGVGIVQAFEAVSTFKPPVVATLEPGVVTATRTPTPGPIDAGSTADIVVTLNNAGGAGATAISATLVSVTPCMTVTAATSTYVNLAAGASASNTTPFAISLSPQCLCPLNLNLLLNVSYTGGVAPSASFPISIDTRESIVINETLDATAPAASLSYLGATGQQTGRLGRDGVVSGCGATKPFPGVFAATGLRQFDTFTFSAAPADRCVGVSLRDLTGTTSKLFTAAYLGSYPNNLTTGYIGDPGSSTAGGAAPSTYAVTVPAGQQPVLAIHEVNVAGAPSNNYQLVVSGLTSCILPFASVLPPGLTTATEAGDGDTFIEPCESGNLAVQVRNRGTVTATTVTGTLTSTTPGISIGTGTAPYADIAGGATGSNTAPFVFSADSSVACGTVANFNLELSFGGGPGGASPVNVPFTVRVGVNPQALIAASTGGTIAPSGNLIAGTSDDDAVVMIATPFALRLYDTVIASGAGVSVSTNGNMQFTATGASAAFSNAALPAAAFGAVPTLLPYWDDLDLIAGGIFSLVSGTTPNRVWTLEWQGVRFGTASAVNFAIRLLEGSDRFEFVYNNSATANGASATIGAQAASPPGTLFTQQAFNFPNAVAVGTVFTGTFTACNGCPLLFANGFE